MCLKTENCCLKTFVKIRVGEKSVWKYIKRCLKTENCCLKTLTKHSLRLWVMVLKSRFPLVHISQCTYGTHTHIFMYKILISLIKKKYIYKLNETLKYASFSPYSFCSFFDAACTKYSTVKTVLQFSLLHSNANCRTRSAKNVSTWKLW